MTSNTAYGNPIHCIGPVDITFTCACCNTRYTAPEHSLDNLYYLTKFAVGEEKKVPVCKDCIDTLFSLILSQKKEA